MTNKVISIDGHDGVGKTTLCQLLTKQLNGIYVRPFGGVVGTDIIQLAEEEKYNDLLELATTTMQDLYSKDQNTLLIFDRHWITIFSLLPKSYWQQWHDFPKTFLVTASLTTIKQRLTDRVEKQFSDTYHTFYLETYLAIAKKFHCTCLSSDKQTPEQLCATIIDYFNKNEAL
jgi:thymidylate kinase